jgi:hypothetical protein
MQSGEARVLSKFEFLSTTARILYQLLKMLGLEVLNEPSVIGTRV